MGSRLSDHGMEFIPADFIDEKEAEQIFAKARAGTAASPLEHRQFSTHMMLFFARLDAEKGTDLDVLGGGSRYDPIGEERVPAAEPGSSDHELLGAGRCPFDGDVEATLVDDDPSVAKGVYNVEQYHWRVALSLAGVWPKEGAR